MDRGLPKPAVQVVCPPGDYGDGPVYVRVNRALAGRRAAGPRYSVEINDWELRSDPEHYYVRVHNSHSAFVYCRWMREDDGIPEQALTVVRKVAQR